MRSRFTLLILLLFTSFAQAWAAPAIETPASFSDGMLDQQVDAWTKDVFRKTPEYLTATPEKTGRLNFGYMRKPVWLRFALKNPEKQARTFILTMDPPLIEDLSLTQFNSAGQAIDTKGFTLQDRVGAGALFRRRPTFKITLPPEAETTFILRLFSTHTMDVHLRLAISDIESRSALTDNLAMGAYYGVFFIIVLLNLMVFFATRDRLYLSYFCFLVALGLQLSCLNGFLDFTFGGGFQFARHLCTLSAASLCSGLLFSRSFLQSEKTAPRLDKVMLALASFAIVLGTLHLTPLYIPYLKFFGYGTDLSIGLSVPLIVAATIVAYRRHYQPAVFFLIAWGSFLGLVLVYFAATYGLIRGSVVSRYAIQIGSAFEMVVLSIALANRVYLLREAKLEAEKKARETDKLRSLIHIICHDLRNPLTVISGLAQAYAQRGLKEWTPIVKAAQSQQEILDYVRLKEAIELGKHKLEMVPVQISDAAENARFLFESRIKEKQLQWQTQIEPGCAALADPTLLIHTVIANLVSNAVKFTPNGGQIHFKAFTSRNQICVEIKDSGIGIPAKLKSHLFSSQASTTRLGTNGERGNGFGMPLVKTVVESFGGSIAVDSQCAEELAQGIPSGTCVTLVLRRA